MTPGYYIALSNGRKTICAYCGVERLSDCKLRAFIAAYRRHFNEYFPQGYIRVVAK